MPGAGIQMTRRAYLCAKSDDQGPMAMPVAIGRRGCETEVDLGHNAVAWRNPGLRTWGGGLGRLANWPNGCTDLRERTMTTFGRVAPSFHVRDIDQAID